MGDMADFALDEVFDEEEAREDFRQGKMDQVEAFERGIIDEQGYEPLPSSGGKRNDARTTSSICDGTGYLCLC